MNTFIAAAPSIIDRVKLNLVDLKMPRALELLDVIGAYALELRIPAIVTTNSDGSRPFAPIDRDQCKGAVRCIF